MELMLRDGDYVPDGKGGVCRVEGGKALLQRVLWKLSIRRGSFPFLPELGSRLYTLGREKPSVRPALARQYVAEALADEPDLEVTGVALTQQEDRLALTVFLDWQGEPLQLQTTV